MTRARLILHSLRSLWITLSLHSLRTTLRSLRFRAGCQRGCSSLSTRRLVRDQDVVARCAVEDVDAGTAEQDVVAGVAGERVVAGAADEHVTPVPPVRGKLDGAGGERGAAHDVVAGQRIH